MPSFFFFNDTATTEIYTLSLHDALPISGRCACARAAPETAGRGRLARSLRRESRRKERSEEHTSELQSRPHLVCRLLLEKKKKVIDMRQKRHFRAVLGNLDGAGLREDTY